MIHLGKIQFAKVFRLTGNCWLDKRRRMPIAGEEINALRRLLKEELETALRPFREELSKRFDEIATQIESLYQRDERRESEYFSIREQIKRIESGMA